MTEEQYKRLSKPYRESKGMRRCLAAADALITALIFLSYPVFLIYAVYNKSTPAFACDIMIPAVSFGFLSLFRRLYSAPRPYEVWDITPLLKKDTRGKSFPSRHVFSVFIIGMTYFHTFHILGAAVLLSGAALACIRVIGGVHFPKTLPRGLRLESYLVCYSGFYKRLFINRIIRRFFCNMDIVRMAFF